MRGNSIDNSEKIDISKLYSRCYKYNTTIYTMLKKYKSIMEKNLRKKNIKPITQNSFFTKKESAVSNSQ